MVRRRSVYMDMLAKRLSMSLYRVVMWARANRRVRDVKLRALAKADKLFNKYYDLTLKYTFRSRIRRDLEKPVNLTRSEMENLRKSEIQTKMKDFGKILDDTL